jgi:hypothetical protein
VRGAWIETSPGARASDERLVAESLEVIQKTSVVILAALETHADESESEASKPPATDHDDTHAMVLPNVLKKTA